MKKYLRAIEVVLKDGKIGMDFDSTRDLMTALTSLRNIHFSAESTKLTARAIHHYNKEGIIPTTGSPIKGRRKYNFYQILWLHMVESLRKIGYSLPNIKIIKEEIFDMKFLDDGNTKIGDPLNFNVFEFIVTLAIIAGDDVHFIVFDKGKYEFVSDKSRLTYNSNYAYSREAHINIPLSNFIIEILELIPTDSPFKDIGIDWQESIINALISTEHGMIKDIKEGGYENVEIQFKNGETEILNAFDEDDPSTRLANILYKKKYHQITLSSDKVEMTFKRK